MKVLITRPQQQAGAFGEAIAAAGFLPVYFPVIEIRPMDDYSALDRALEKLGCYDWLVFTSVNGVEAVFERLALAGRELPDRANGSRPRVAAIGPKTAQALQVRGLAPDFVPDEYVAEAILPGLGDLRGKWVLLPRAEIARKALPQAIADADGVAHEIAVYRTIPAEPDTAGLAALRSGVDWITFTSPSTVHNFTALVRAADLDPLALPGEPRIACIGPITRQAALEEGYTGLVVAEEYTTEGLLAAIR